MEGNHRIKLSIITICKNCENTIAKCLTSVVSLKDERIQYIVIDGNSTDETPIIISKFKSAIDCYIHEADRGISDAFNKGIALAKGSYISFLNADDTYFPGAIEIILTEIARIEIELPVDNWPILHADIKLDVGHLSKNVKPKNLFLFRYLLPINHPASFVPTKLLKNNPFSEKYKIAMDYDVLSKFYIQKVHFKYISVLTTHMSDLGISNASFIKGYREARLISQENIGLSKLESNCAYYIKVVVTAIKKQLNRLTK